MSKEKPDKVGELRRWSKFCGVCGVLSFILATAVLSYSANPEHIQIPILVFIWCMFFVVILDGEANYLELRKQVEALHEKLDKLQKP